MNFDKKNTITRIIIFVALAYAPMIAIGIILDSRGSNDSLYLLLAEFAGFSPAVSNILTRLITKEGFSETYLRANFRGNIKYYIFGIVYAVVCSVLSTAVMILIYCPDYSFSEADFGRGSLAMILLSVVSGTTFFWVTFGEEFGWRAYLTPKLERLLSEPAALIISGIIWGLWHAPLTVHGHNFGFGYWGFPYTGFAVMSLSCILLGCFLTWLTKKTGSVYPASICHGCINGMIIPSLLIPDYYDLCEAHSFGTGLGSMSAHILFGIVFFVLLSKKVKAKN